MHGVLCALSHAPCFFFKTEVVYLMVFSGTRVGQKEWNSLQYTVIKT